MLNYGLHLLLKIDFDCIKFSDENKLLFYSGYRAAGSFCLSVLVA